MKPSGVALGFVLALVAVSGAPANELFRCAVPADIQAKVDAYARADQAERFLRSKDVFSAGMQALPALIQLVPSVLPRSAAIDGLKEDRKDGVRQLTALMRSLIQTHGVPAINLFRACDDSPDVIKPLIWVARGDDREARINAASVLANVIDNSNVCFVLHHLEDPALDVNGRANLLGITNAVASYAFSENVTSMRTMVANVRERVARSPGLEQTNKLVASIEQRANASSNENTPLPPNLARHCAGYDFAKPLD